MQRLRLLDFLLLLVLGFHGLRGWDFEAEGWLGFRVGLDQASWWWRPGTEVGCRREVVLLLRMIDWREGKNFKRFGLG